MPETFDYDTLVWFGIHCIFGIEFLLLFKNVCLAEIDWKTLGLVFQATVRSFTLQWFLALDTIRLPPISTCLRKANYSQIHWTCMAGGITQGLSLWWSELLDTHWDWYAVHFSGDFLRVQLFLQLVRKEFLSLNVCQHTPQSSLSIGESVPGAVKTGNP